MSKASDVVHNLITRPRSPLEIQRERETTRVRPKQFVMNGQVFQLASNPSETPQLIETLPQRVDD